MTYYKCEHFSAHELVPRQVYEDRGEKSFQLIDKNLLRFIDFLRNKFGSATINNWYWGGDREWSGLRTADSPYFSQYSQHTLGRAVDIVFKDYTAEEVRFWLKANVEEWILVTGVLSITIEEGVSWLHIDFRNNGNGYNSFNP